MAVGTDCRIRFISSRIRIVVFILYFLVDFSRCHFHFCLFFLSMFKCTYIFLYCKIPMEKMRHSSSSSCDVCREDAEDGDQLENTLSKFNIMYYDNPVLNQRIFRLKALRSFGFLNTFNPNRTMERNMIASWSEPH